MSTKTKQRSRSKERFWRKALKQRARSGLTIRAFCEREGLTESSYQFWRRELAKRDADGAVNTSERKGNPPARRKNVARLPGFAEVTIAQSSNDNHSRPIEIILPGDVRVRVASGFDREALRDVLLALEEPSC